MGTTAWAAPPSPMPSAQLSTTDQVDSSKKYPNWASSRHCGIAGGSCGGLEKQVRRNPLTRKSPRPPRARRSSFRGRHVPLLALSQSKPRSPQAPGRPDETCAAPAARAGAAGETSRAVTAPARSPAKWSQWRPQEGREKLERRNAVARAGATRRRAPRHGHRAAVRARNLPPTSCRGPGVPHIPVCRTRLIRCPGRFG